MVSRDVCDGPLRNVLQKIIRRTASDPIFGVTTEFYVTSVINAGDWAAPGDKRS